MTRDPLDLMGFMVHEAFLSLSEQKTLVTDLRQVVSTAPLFSPMTPYGKPMTVQMTSAGKYGWYADAKGYRYEKTHPDGVPWPEIPQSVLRIWRLLVDDARMPDCCLVNYYRDGARMGLHQDRDESDFSWPVLSVSLGDDALFRVGQQTRGGTTRSIWLRSGDVVVMGGDARLSYHGIDRIRFGTSTLLKSGGRINLTCRVVD